MALIDTILEIARNKGASDIHIGTNRQPVIRLHGELACLTEEETFVDDSRKLLFSILTKEQQDYFQKNFDLDFSYTAQDGTRYRGNIFYQHRGGVDGVFRVIPSAIPDISELGLPAQILNFTHLHQGLVLVTGPMGSGKTTTLAALTKFINETRSDHIITIEDPIEFLFQNEKAIINQREIQRHTTSYTSALRAALREDPDIIIVGEMRDLDTISLALTAAETGHLVFGTLHTTDAVSTVNRIIDVFPPGEQNKIRMMLAESLNGVISQQLIPRKDGSGMVVASELLITTPALSNLIRDNKTFHIPSIIQSGKAKHGMRLLDDSINDLLSQEIITGKSAFAFAHDKNQFRSYLQEASNGKN